MCILTWETVIADEFTHAQVCLILAVPCKVTIGLIHRGACVQVDNTPTAATFWMY